MNFWLRGLAYVVFLLSGIAALIYEISWSRQLGLLFGHTVHAASVVLGSYFAGMAVGYSLGGALSHRVRPLLGYAVAETVVAVWAFFIPVVLTWSESPAVAGWLVHELATWQIVFRVVFSFLLLMPATIALGVTLPMMAAWLSQGDGASEANGAARISFAYAVNTFGALVGVTFTTLWMLINCGVAGSSYIAAGLSLVCAVIAVLIESKFVPQGDDGNRQSESNGGLKNALTANGLIWRLRLTASVIGFAILALQVLYTRMFSLVFHNSTYTFGIVVAVFLAALAAGAACAGRCGSMEENVLPLAGWAMAASAVYIVVSVRLFVAVTDLDYFRFGGNFVEYMVGATGLVVLVVGPGVLLAGAVLPIVWRFALSVDGDAGRVVGQLTSVNTISAAVGALAASFLILPWIGLWSGFVFIGGVMMLIAVSVILEDLTHGRRLGLACVWTFLAMMAVLAPTESGASRRASEQTIRRWHSPYGWIDLVKDFPSALERSSNAVPEVFKIRQNLHYRFGKTGSNAREYRQAHLPLLMHPDPQDVLFLGLGTGLTAAGAIPHPEVRKITAVELIPEVIEAAGALAKYNFGVVDHEKTTIVSDDGRHFLLATNEQFDVIVSDLFVPWESESGYLYTVEHYEVAATRLKEGGLFCQWLPLYQVGEFEFESIANSFSKVFPSVTLWWGKLSGSRGPVIALVGKQCPIQIDSEATNQRIERLGLSMGVDPSIANLGLVMEHFLGQWNSARSRSAVTLNRDEFPVVEFSTPISNRDRELISGAVFEEYYLRTLVMLDLTGVIVDERPVEDRDRLRARQTRLLFGGRQ